MAARVLPFGALGGPAGYLILCIFLLFFFGVVTGVLVVVCCYCWRCYNARSFPSPSFPTQGPGRAEELGNQAIDFVVHIRSFCPE